MKAILLGDMVMISSVNKKVKLPRIGNLFFILWQDLFLLVFSIQFGTPHYLMIVHRRHFLTLEISGIGPITCSSVINCLSFFQFLNRAYLYVKVNCLNFSLVVSEN